jgi:hypothetical protein
MTASAWQALGVKCGWEGLRQILHSTLRLHDYDILNTFDARSYECSKEVRFEGSRSHQRTCNLVSDVNLWLGGYIVTSHVPSVPGTLY